MRDFLDMPDARTRHEQGLALSGISLSRNGTTLLNDITCALPPSGITAVMGPNGAGKSLLLRVAHGLIDADQGLVLWQGDAVTEEARKAQAMVFQKPVLLRRSVEANVDFALKVAGIRHPSLRDALLNRVGLKGRNKQPARLLSGGEQQRLALARALATSPKLLFLDEPTASLDPTSARVIEDILHEEREAGTKIVLVTHDVPQARRLADDVLFLTSGQLHCHQDAASFFQTPDSAKAARFLAGHILN
jgi:tungstate transport system ATP-binding protein